MKNIILGACLLAALATIGCKKKTAPPPPELSVTLVDPGQSPVELLRYSIPVDTVVKTLLDIRDADATVPQTEDSVDAFGVLPGLKLLLHAGPTVPLPKGTRYILRISKAESVLPEGVTERQMAEVEQGVQVLRGMRGRFDLNGQGIVVDADVPWAQGQGAHPSSSCDHHRQRAVGGCDHPAAARAGWHWRGMGGPKALADLERTRDTGDAIRAHRPRRRSIPGGDHGSPKSSPSGGRSQPEVGDARPRLRNARPGARAGRPRSSAGA